MKKVPIFPGCFVCGKDNPIGLRLEAFYEPGTVRASFIPKPEHCGWEGIVHGGIIAAVLDEVMVWVPWSLTGKFYFTGEINIRFIKPVISGTSITATAKTVKSNRRVHEAEAVLSDDNGIKYATAFGKYIEMSRGQENSFLQQMKPSINVKE